MPEHTTRVVRGKRARSRAATPRAHPGKPIGRGGGRLRGLRAASGERRKQCIGAVEAVFPDEEAIGLKFRMPGAVEKVVGRLADLRPVIDTTVVDFRGKASGSDAHRDAFAWRREFELAVLHGDRRAVVG